MGEIGKGQEHLPSSRRGALYTVYSSIYGIFVHILDTLHEYLLSDYYMLCIQFPPLQGGGHRFKSCTAHQGKSKPPAQRVVFLLCTLMAEAWSGGTVSTVPLFLSHTTLTYRQGRSVDMIRVYPDGDGEDANDSRCGPPYFYVGKFCFFLVFVLSNQTEAGTPCPFKAIWSGYGRRSVFFSAG